MHVKVDGKNPKNKELCTEPTGLSTYWTVNVRKIDIDLRILEILKFRQKNGNK
jgi:hypothetical protein